MEKVKKNYMRRSGIEPEFKRWQRSVIAATLPAQADVYGRVTRLLPYYLKKIWVLKPQELFRRLYGEDDERKERLPRLSW